MLTACLLGSFSDTRKEGPSLLLVLKWGGELTPAGRVQAEELGRAFRCMYPGGQGEIHSSMFSEGKMPSSVYHTHASGSLTAFIL